MLFSLFAVITILFFLFRIVPGDPTSHIVSPQFTQEQREAILARYGLNQPLHIQYVLYMKNLMLGSLGRSFQYNEPVLPFLMSKAVNTVVITVPSVIMAFVVGPLLGANFAWNRGGKLDNVGTATVLFSFSAPVFWTGMVAIMFFSFYLGWLPSGGMHSPGFVSESILDRFTSVDFLRHAILPIVIYTLWILSMPVLIARNSMIDILDSEFITLKRAEGVPDRTIRYRHGLRNSLLPVLHYSALSLGFAFGGSVILETVFNWPGLGRAMWQAVLSQDYPVAQGSFLFLAAMIILFNFLADIFSVVVDPRVADEEVVE
jgi:peptide/nickel transport system permease protein